MHEFYLLQSPPVFQTAATAAVMANAATAHAAETAEKVALSEEAFIEASQDGKPLDEDDFDFDAPLTDAHRSNARCHTRHAGAEKRYDIAITGFGFA